MGSRVNFAVLAALLCQIVADPAAATVVRDQSAPVSNQGTEVGGHRLPPQPYTPPLPYSFLGAIEAEGNWFMQCAIWPWRRLGNWGWFRYRELRDARRIEEIPRFEERRSFDHRK